MNNKLHQLILFLMLSFPAMASASFDDYQKFYEVDLDAPLPDLKALKSEFIQSNQSYSPNYILSYDMGRIFKPVVAEAITNYGQTEKRIKAAGEDELYEQILSLPKEYYPYIGPNLHANPGISEKILNIPGIKETKNQFPKVIAPQLQDIEDLEFLSPHLYLLLMPQMWPSNQKPIEKPVRRPVKVVQSKYDADFFARVLSKVPGQGFGGAKAQGEEAPADKLRTLRPTKTSPLTAADMKAFVNTLQGVRDFGRDNMVKVIEAGALLDYWETKNGQSLMINGYKDVVNPCQRLALKIKWAGLENKFMQTIAPQAFNLNEWAYTCDKTIKAYRIARMSKAQLAGIDAFKRGLFDEALKSYNEKWRNQQYLTLQTMTELYKAPAGDVSEALKNESEIADEINKLHGMLITSPIVD